MPNRTERSRILLALSGLTILTRLPALLYSRPIDDEAVYAVVARVMLAGGLPYRDAIERKPPLLFAVYWAVLRLFGPANWLALHLVAVAWVLVTMAGLFVLAERLVPPAGSAASGQMARPAHGVISAGAVAALAYALVQPWATAKNLAFNGEVLMNLPLVWAYALVLAPRRPAPAPPLAALLPAPFAAGLLLGAAFLLKQPAAIAALPLGLYLVGAPLWRDDGRWRQALAQAAALTIGFVAVLAAGMAVMARYGLLAEAWYWTMADHTVPHVFWQHGLAHTALFVSVALPLVAPLTAWRPLRQAWRGRAPELWAVLGWLVVSAIGAAAGGRFYPHYYIQLIPPLAVLSAVFYAHADRPHPRWLTPRFAMLWLGFAGLATVAVQIVQLRALRPSPAALYAAAHTDPADRLFVWGQQTSFYLDADRLPASRYIATYPLTGYIFGGPLPGISTRDRILPGAWAGLASDLARHPARCIVDTQAHPGDTYPIRDFPALGAVIARDYQPIGVFSDGTVYCRPARPTYRTR